MSGVLIAAPSSGSGKTTITLGLLRALRERGLPLAPGKAGPDYIDPAFHTAASGALCLNFDPWAMRPGLLQANAARHAEGGKLLIVEAMMGLHDAAMDGRGSPADLATLLGLTVVFVVDCARMAQSVAALVAGYRGFRQDIRFGGVILNRVGSDKHAAMLTGALDAIGMPVLGIIRADPALRLPERHLGLVQAGEQADLDRFIDHAALRIAEGCDLDALTGLAAGVPPSAAAVRGLPPLGQHVAVARDIAFAFSYPHLLEDWRRQGAEISFFSPLAGEGPHQDADAIYLPGGYPELHGPALAAASGFHAGMRAARDRGARIFGECGGYMALGEAIIDAAGQTHAMLGLLPVVTSFAHRRRHLGYRRLSPVDRSFFAGALAAHEFHYAQIVSEGDADRLFLAQDASGADLGPVGLRRERVAGSFMHLIDLAEAA
ncbi:cobyrinic acid a,c-diamide synthase [Xaviernesmea oryzae]|uniref:Hydrogenobyrinate a,c-diamide synthase n=1 Tax=Xaviernesmea oryzae TaxID=464029 RepID=A0A1Q9B0J1_9HYPH|nr:cobyrinate a,c-diamide synthase [Xaviernesmea oryzae]OLP61493.1 cobyrinic acid a,c-diamide synthase [Xaviernesmea oryzae]SEL67534.1 cobyrinic acid a,c-diamide synthase [Xaviernesmea oryzae]